MDFPGLFTLEPHVTFEPNYSTYLGRFVNENDFLPLLKFLEEPPAPPPPPHWNTTSKEDADALENLPVPESDIFLRTFDLRKLDVNDVTVDDVVFLERKTSNLSHRDIHFDVFPVIVVEKTIRNTQKYFLGRKQDGNEIVFRPEHIKYKAGPKDEFKLKLKNLVAIKLSGNPTARPPTISIKGYTG